MVELSCVFGPCLEAFSKDPLGLLLLGVFGSIAVLSAYTIITRESIRSKIKWSYPLLFSVLFVLTYFTFTMSCHASAPFCSDHALLYSVPAAFLGSLLFGYVILPSIYLAWARGRLAKSLAAYLPESVPVYVSDSGKPFAYSYGGFRRWIVVSQGMLEILTKKELQAVLLHEYGHIAGNTSIYKASRWVYSKIPLLHAVVDGKLLEDEEELRADRFAVEAQGTAKHLNSAKRKLKHYFGC